MKILVVDDNAANRKLLRYNLEHHGCEVIEASEGAEGLHLASIKNPDLIVSDALMPVMDGFQFLRAVKKNDTLKMIPFVFYSAVYTGSQETEFALALGAEAFILKPKDPDEFWDELWDIIETTKSGQGKPYHAEPIDDEHEYLQRYGNIVATKLEEKVQELEAANATIKESEQFIKNILESVDEGIVVIDPEFRIVSANRAYRLYSRLSSGNAVGKHCYECSHGLDKPCYETGVDCPVKHTFETGRMASAIHTHYDSDGSPVLYEVKSFPMKDTAGKVTAVVETFLDITEKTQLEAQLRQAQKMESIGTLAGGIAHDFNNILTAILGYGDLALMEMAADNPQRLDVENMLAGVARAAHLTKDLLLFSRKQVSERKIVDLNDVIRQIANFLKRVIGEDVVCNFMLQDQAIPINADQHQLEQVLMNFATNARDAMPGGGVFTVSARQVHLNEDSPAVLGSGKPGAYAMITVEDTGRGMDEKTRQRIFDPFFTTKEVGKGTGLGLAVVYGIIKQHDGYIDLSSEPGKGTTFRIYLPVVVETEVTEKTKTEQKELPARGTETILLAEDDESVRSLETYVLTQSGYTIIAAVDGEDAVRKFMENQDKIQLLLFDFLMPKMNGKEAYDQIRKIKPGIRVIFASGYTPDVVQQKTSGENESHLILKPVSPIELLRKVRSVLDETA